MSETETILDIAEKLDYDLSDPDKRNLLRFKKSIGDVDGDVNNSWFRVFLVEFKKYPSYDEDSSLGYLEKVDKHLYPMVKSVVCHSFMTAIERNQATTFHRTAKAAIKRGIKNGFDFSKGIKDITKTELIQLGTVKETSVEDAINYHIGKLRSISRQHTDLVPELMAKVEQLKEEIEQ